MAKVAEGSTPLTLMLRLTCLLKSIIQFQLLNCWGYFWVRQLNSLWVDEDMRIQDEDFNVSVRVGSFGKKGG